MTGFHHISSFDAERAANQLDQQGQALAKMASADSQRIDGLVDDVGQIKGQVSAVNAKVDSVATGVDKLNTAIAGLVKFTIQVEHEHKAQEAQRLIVSAQESRIQALERQVEPMVKAEWDKRVPQLERQIGPLVELRAWVIGGGLFCLTLIGLALAKLIFK